MEKDNKVSNPTRCSYSGRGRGIGGLTCGLELELKLSDRTGVKINTFNNRRSSISELLFKSLSDRNPDVMKIAHQRRQFREEL